jgi:hypothetical protein
MKKHLYSFIIVAQGDDDGTAYAVRAKNLSDGVKKFIKDYHKSILGKTISDDDLKELHEAMMPTKYEIHRRYWVFTYDADCAVSCHQLS